MFKRKQLLQCRLLPSQHFVHSLRTWHFLESNRSNQRRHVSSVQHRHVLGCRILFLLLGLCSWHIRQWDENLYTLLLRHVLYCCWCTVKIHLQYVSTRHFFLVVMDANLLSEVRWWHLQCDRCRLVYSLRFWELRHRRGFHIMHIMRNWYIYPFSLSAMQILSRWYLLECHVSDVGQHLSSMRQRILLLENWSSVVHHVHARDLPPLYRGYQLLELLIMCSGQLW